MRRGLTWLFVFAPGVTWVVLSFHETTWWIENVVAFPALFLIVYWGMGFALLLFRQWFAAATCGLLSAVFLMLAPKSYQLQVSNCVNPITVAQYNLYYENNDINAFINYLIEQPKDLVVLQEVAPEIGDKLHTLSDIYPFHYGGQEGIGYPSSQMILSRSPLTDMSVYLTPDEQAIIRGTWHPAKHVSMTLVAAHPPSPRTKALWYRRNALIRTIESLNELYPSDEIVVIGDFNLSSTSLRFGKIFPSYQTLPVASWPYWTDSISPPDFSMISIDHLWLKSATSGRRICERQSIAKPNGSDHKLVVTKIGY
ncbi:endonuclease/exonuclease/phosphatase family protein [Vibrio sp. TBV020]|uniref:endonuclease/exonuclease/phosphatase family protein n=1 Tax=Vibrio sp. TBV020 TaxID=3137398 RepID=UPI0038CD959B